MKDTKEMKDIVKNLAKLLDVPIWLVKESVGIKLEECHSGSIEEVKMAYLDADKGSEEERTAQEKLKMLLLNQLKNVGTKGMKDIYYIAKELEIYEVEIAAFHSWDELAMEYVEKAQTDEELKLAYDNTPKNSNSRRAAIEKKSKWSLNDLKQAKSLDEHIRACKRAPNNSEAKRVAIRHIFEDFFEN